MSKILPDEYFIRPSKCDVCVECRRITMDELRTHHEPSKAWIAYKGYVYDVTKFLKEHPGGEEVLLENAGRDATAVFTDVGHSKDALKLMVQYKIGRLVTEKKKKKKE